MDEWIKKRSRTETYTSRVLHLVILNSGITVRQITERSGIARGPVKSALTNLKTAGKVRVVVREYPHKRPGMIGYYYAIEEK